MSISVIDPVGWAIHRTQSMLFGPIQLEKWFTLGFCAFLAQLGSNGGGGFNGFSGGGGGGGGPGPAGGAGGEGAPGDDMRRIMEALQENLTPIILGVSCLLVVGVAVGMLLTWLSSRGQFMFIDGVARNRGAVVEPWREYRAEGNSLFWFRFWFGLATVLAFFLAGGVCLLIAWPDIQAQRFGPMAAAAIAAFVASFLVLGVVSGCVRVFLLHFVAPMMYARRIPVGEGWREFGRVMLAGHKGTLVLYVLFQIVIGIGVGLIALVVTCLTCCLAALPYLSSVILLPLHVFGRSYSIYFLEQFGPEWQILQPIPLLAPSDAPPQAQ